MRQKKILYKIIAVSTAVACTFSSGIMAMAAGVGTSAQTWKKELKAGVAAAEEEIIKIMSADDLLMLTGQCALDEWSAGKTVLLETDIDLSDSDFTSIPVFGGTFDGQGHTISGFSIEKSGDVQGFFRYIQKAGTVKNLTVEGEVLPEGHRDMIGGIVGSNSGLLSNCTFLGTVKGRNQIGGIAGVNEANGQLINCSFEGELGGEHYAGGIAGQNLGSIIRGKNRGSIDTTEVKVSVELAEFDLMDSLKRINSVENVPACTDVGGIAGASSGIVQSCENYGDVGYEHVGYNIGGIVGRQSGYLDGCVNEGSVRGRKDVGGIAGQFEPKMVLIYNKGTMSDLWRELENMQKLLDTAIKDAKGASAAVFASIGVLSDSTKNVQDATGELTDSLVGWADENIGEINDFSARISWAMDRLDPAADSFGEALSLMGDASGQLSEALKEGKAVMALGSEAAGALSDAMGDIGDSISAAEDVLEEMRKAIEAFEGEIGNSDQMKDALRRLGNSCTRLGEIFAGIAESERLNAAIKTLEGSDNPQAVKLAEYLSDMQEVYSEFGEALTELGDKLQELAAGDGSIEGLSEVLYAAELLGSEGQRLKAAGRAVASALARLDLDSGTALEEKYEALLAEQLKLEKALNEMSGLVTSGGGLTDASEEELIKGLKGLAEQTENVRNAFEALEKSDAAGAETVKKEIAGGREKLDEIEALTEELLELIEKGAAADAEENPKKENAAPEEAEKETEKETEAASEEAAKEEETEKPSAKEDKEETESGGAGSETATEQKPADSAGSGTEQKPADGAETGTGEDAEAEQHYFTLETVMEKASDAGVSQSGGNTPSDDSAPSQNDGSAENKETADGKDSAGSSELPGDNKPSDGTDAEKGEGPSDSTAPGNGEDSSGGQGPTEGADTERGESPADGQEPSEGADTEDGEGPSGGQEPSEGADAESGADPADGQGPSEGADSDHEGSMLNGMMEALVKAGDSLSSSVDNLGEALKKLAAVKEPGTEMLGSLSKASSTLKDSFKRLAEGTAEIRTTLAGLAEQPAIQFTPLDSRITGQKDALQDALGNMADQMDGLNAVMDTSSEILLSDMEAINRQFGVIIRLLRQESEEQSSEIEDRFEDVSDESEDYEQQDGTISGSHNAGEIQGDVNVAGIVGSMAVEYDFDPEDDLTLYGDSSLDFSWQTSAVLRSCKNTGEIIAKKDHAGGIVGRMDLGRVSACESYGPVRSDQGSYVGGIAGDSYAIIRNCWAKCSLSGTDYIGGIAGVGTTITGCHSLIEVEKGSAFLGTIAGWMDEDGELENNTYVNKNLAAVDNISYARRAEPVTYDELMSGEDTPEMFRQFELTFVADEEVVAVVPFQYGKGVSRLPEIPAKEGYSAKWPDIDYSCLTFSQTLEAEYVPYESVLAAAGEVPQLLVDGNFSSEAVVEHSEEEMSFVDESGREHEGIAVTVRVEDPVLEEVSYTIHYRLPEQGKKYRLWVHTEKGWEKAEYEMDGAYLLLNHDAKEITFLVEAYSNGWIVILTAAGIVILLVVFWSIKKAGNGKKRKKRNK